MNIFKSIVFASACFFLFSCSSDSEKPKVSSNKNSVKISDCLAGYDYDYSKLLTKEDVLKHVSVNDPSKIKMKFDDYQKMNAPEYGECSYVWDSERPNMEMTVSGNKQKVPDMNRVAVSKLMFQEGNIDKIQEKFNTSYKKLTPQEVEEANARLEKSYKDKPEKELETAKGFVKARANMEFEQVDQLGDLAYWRKSNQFGADWGVELIVLVGKVNFTIQVKTSDDMNENLEVAKKMAEEVLSKCK